MQALAHTWKKKNLPLSKEFMTWQRRISDKIHKTDLSASLPRILFFLISAVTTTSLNKEIYFPTREI